MRGFSIFFHLITFPNGKRLYQALQYKNSDYICYEQENFILIGI